jgi:hypothetical protein
MMTKYDFARLNILSEKALSETASRRELKEFYGLFERWNASVRFNLINGLRE